MTSETFLSRLAIAISTESSFESKSTALAGLGLALYCRQLWNTLSSVSLKYFFKPISKNIVSPQSLHALLGISDTEKFLFSLLSHSLPTEHTTCVIVSEFVVESTFLLIQH